MADQDGIIPDLAALVRAVLFGDRTAAVYAERLASRILGGDGSTHEIEAGLRKALGAACETAVARLDREQLGTVLSALEDAADYRREYQDGDCAGCEELPKGVLCGDHETDEAMASMYDLLHEELQEHQGGGGTFRCALCGIEVAAIDAARFVCARDPDADGKDSVMLRCTDRDTCQERQDGLR